MDITEHRKRRLAKLVEAEPSKAAFARKYSIDATYLSQILNGHRNLGEKAARKMESQIGLPSKYLDQNALATATAAPEVDDAIDPGGLSDYEQDLINAFRAADKTQRLKVLLYLNGEADSLTPARPFGLNQPSVYAEMDIYEDLDAQVEEHSSNVHSLAEQLRSEVSGKSAETIRQLADRMEAEALAVRDAYLQRFKAQG